MNNSQIKSRFLIYALALCISVPAFAQKKPVAQTKPVVQSMPADPAVKVGKLANGFTYYIRKNTEPKNRAVLYMATKIGSLMENDDQQGLAHFTEHMAFNGTKDFPKNEVISYLQKAGVKFGADLNAYTGFNQTVYQLPIPTDSVEVFKTGFKILANWAGKLTMDGSEIDKERGVIVEEDRQRGKNATERMSKQLLPFLLYNSRYEKRLPIGKIDLLQTFTHDKIRNFYADWYRPNLQSIIAVGDFDVAQVEQLIKDNFSSLKNPTKPRPRLNYDLPDNKAPLVKIITDVEQPYNVALILFKSRGDVTKTSADVKNSIEYNMINSMLAARIQEMMQKGDAPFLYAASTYGPYQGGLVYGINAFQTVAVAKTSAELEKAITAAMAENERMVKFGFTQSELDVALKNVTAANEKSFKERDKTTSNAFVQQYLDNFLTGKSMPSIEYAYKEVNKHLASIALAEINALAKTLITKENRIIVVQAPEKEKASLPTEAALLAAINNAGNNLTAYEDNAITTPLLERKPLAGKVTAETKNEKVGTTQLTLSNGVKVVLKPTNFKNDQIIFTSFGKGGSSIASNDDFLSAENASLITVSGVGAFNPSQLNKYLAGNTASASSYISSEYQGFSGSAAPKDLETAFQLIYAYATMPRKDAELFNKNISDYRAQMKNRNASPQNVFADTSQAVLVNYHKRGMPLNESALDKISLDKAFAFYKQRFEDASGQTFVFVGNFDVEKIKPFIETYLGSLPATNKNENFKDNGIRAPKGIVVKTVKRGLEDKANVELYLHGDFNYSIENSLELDALSSALENKILERLREKESGVYSPSVRLTIDREPSVHYYFNISFSCAAGNVDKLIKAAMEEVNSIKNNGVTEDDLKKFRAEEQRSEELSLRDNGFWLSYLTNRLKYGEDLTRYQGDKARLDQLSMEKLKVAAKKYLGGENYIQLVLAPEK